MTRLILVYGVIAGIIVSTFLIGGIALDTSAGEGHGGGSLLFGYLTMLIALSMIFVAIKRHRDTALGGVIKFWPAVLLGLAVAGVASLIYVATWEVYFRITDGAFTETYVNSVIEAQRAAGVSGAELEAFSQQARDSMALYGNWWFRMPMTFAEIFPVGLIVTLIAAALLRNPGFLPRTVRE
tara:strand:- start:5685 stop:6230 length:546 start_codon:yes stop_codon:yes gene_type:complete